ncbi:hypothetical protein ACFZAM_31340 [Streptomyces sp. NPDC008079]|uniref:hypothetical protein n=1 Tax=Streptomyces sp. NPDC008079 TaxID=3364806 RepID=UPI0036E4CD82
MASLGRATAAKMTPAEKRKMLAREAAAATADAPARRGEDDAIPTGVQPKEALPRQASASPGPIEPQLDDVTLGRESHAFTYIAPPSDADIRDQIAHHRRRIVVGNTALSDAVGRLERDYILSVGRHVWEATSDNKALKAAGYKSVEAFGETIGLSKQDVYRIRRALPVYEVIADMVEAPLNERTVRVLYGTLTDENNDFDPTPERQERLRTQFAQMKLAGKVNSSGAVWARKLLVLGPLADLMEPEPEVEQPDVVLKLKQAVKSRRLVELDLLQQVKEQNPEAARTYVDQLRERYEAAAALVQG